MTKPIGKITVEIEGGETYRVDVYKDHTVGFLPECYLPSQIAYIREQHKPQIAKLSDLEPGTRVKWGLRCDEYIITDEDTIVNLKSGVSSDEDYFIGWLETIGQPIITHTPE